MNFILKQKMEQRKIVSVYVNQMDPDDFLTGIIERVDATHYLLAEIDPWGGFDGYRVRRVADIHHILSDEEYEFRLGALMKIYGTEMRPLIPEMDLDASVFLSVLDACRVQNRIVTVYCGNNIYSGRVMECNDLRFEMRLFDFYGQIAGNDTFSMKEVDVLQVGSMEEDMYLHLEQVETDEWNQLFLEEK